MCSEIPKVFRDKFQLIHFHQLTYNQHYSNNIYLLILTAMLLKIGIYLMRIHHFCKTKQQNYYLFAILNRQYYFIHTAAHLEAFNNVFTSSDCKFDSHLTLMCRSNVCNTNGARLFISLRNDTRCTDV